MAPKMALDPAIERAAAGWRRKNVIGLLIMAGILIGSSGDVRWAAGWLFVASMAAIQVVLYLALARKRPELFVERSRIQPGTKKWDKILVALVAILPMVMWAVAGLDERFGWRPLDTAWQAPAFALVLGGSAFVVWAMLTNRFFAVTVRIQEERGHSVVDNGPYALVRHPGYAGSIVVTLATPFALGSGWALAPAILCVVLLIVRTALEDRTLQAELNGYAEYASRVRSRLVPAVW